MPAHLDLSCFVIMPFGKKPDTDGKIIDFDAVYRDVIASAVTELEELENLKIDCVRCDDIEEAGSIRTDMFESILRADIAVVDITSLNPNVFYELGMRHAVKECVTVMICRMADQMPFNIQGFRAITYEPEDPGSLDAAKKDIQSFIVNGLNKKKVDSPIRELLPDLNVSYPTPPLRSGDKHPYRLRARPEKTIALVTGDIKRLKGVADVWVSSENTHMQQARFHDKSISGMIRYLGASKKQGQVSEDLIGDALKAALDWNGEIRTVLPGHVEATESGELLENYGVKRIFHAATVQGVPGGGYAPVPNLEDCVRNALEVADRENGKAADTNASGDPPLRSILFPILGTGTARGELKSSVSKMILEAISYFEMNDSQVDTVYLLTYDKEQLTVGLDVLNELVRKKQLEGPVEEGSAS